MWKKDQLLEGTVGAIHRMFFKAITNDAYCASFKKDVGLWVSDKLIRSEAAELVSKLLNL